MQTPIFAHIPSLDGLRAISIGMVVWGQFFSSRNQAVSDLGVRFFFVISGLLVTSLLMQEIEETEQINLWKFYFRRALRVVLPYYVFLFLLVLAQPFGWVAASATDFAHALTFTSNYQLEHNQNLAHLWSLSVILQFYLLWPVALLLLGVRRGLTSAALLLLICPLLRLAMYWLWPERTPSIGHQFETIADALAMGCLLAGQQFWPAPVRAFYEWILQSRLMLIVPLIAVLANAMHEHPLSFFFFGHTVMNVCAALCLDWAIRNHEGLLGRALHAPPLVWLGVMSYSLYLWQQLFLHRESSLWVAGFLQNLFCALLAAAAFYFLVERPALQLRQWWEPRLFNRTTVIEQLEQYGKVLPFEGGSPSMQARRALRLSAWLAPEQRDEKPTESFLPALKRLERRNQHGSLSEALWRLSFTVRSKR